MKTNIVMLVKDRWELTAQSLTSLFYRTDSTSFNLTIIDDESLDKDNAANLVNVIRENENMAMLRVVNSQGITGRVRNLGVYWSEKTFGRGDFLYLSDNDVFFTVNWLDRLINAMLSSEVNNEGFKLLGGSNHPYHGTNATYLVSENSEIHEHHAVAGYSHLMRWEMWDKYGPLDAHAKGVRQSEDHQFCTKIIADGGKVGSVWPEVVLACGLTDTFGSPAPGQDVLKRYEGLIQL